jgi:hypothetical protein
MDVLVVADIVQDGMHLPALVMLYNVNGFPDEVICGEVSFPFSS